MEVPEYRLSKMKLKDEAIDKAARKEVISIQFYRGTNLSGVMSRRFIKCCDKVPLDAIIVNMLSGVKSDYPCILGGRFLIICFSKKGNIIGATNVDKSIDGCMRNGGQVTFIIGMYHALRKFIDKCYSKQVSEGNPAGTS